MNILITSVGRRSYLVNYFKDSLQGIGKVYASNSVPTIATQEADGFFISPLIYESNYVTSLVDFCIENEINAIISVFDIDLLVLAKSKEYIEKKGILLLLSDEKTVEICNDKWKTYEFLKKNQFQTPTTFKDIDSFKKAESKNLVKFPVIIKPRWGMASMGIYSADNLLELDVLYKKSINDIDKSYLKYESSLTPDKMVLIQEKLNGQEFGIDVISDLYGKYVGCFPKSKIQMRAGETDLGQTVDSTPFEDISRRLVSSLNSKIILSVDCFIHDNEITILEINCRISGHYPISHLAGINLPNQITKWIQGFPTDFSNFNFKKGLYVTKDLVPRIVNC